MSTFGAFLVSFDAETQDVTAPDIINESPAPGAVDVSTNTNISFDIVDDGAGAVDETTIAVTVDGQDAIADGVFQSGFSGTITAQGTGFSVTIDPDQPLRLSDTHTVTAQARDLAGNLAQDSWSFTVETGPLETPVLTALSGGPRVYLSWTVNPAMRVDAFELRRSTVAFPTLPTEGDLVYSGLDKSTVDNDVAGGVTYYYTVFALHKPGVYVDYDEQASDDATPRAVVVSVPVVGEYVPQRGEFGAVVAYPAAIASHRVWGTMTAQGRETSDNIVAGAGTAVRAPVAGIVVATAATSLALDSAVGGFRFHLDGVVPVPGMAAGKPVRAGELVARFAHAPLTFSIVKLPTGRYGHRTVRPAYFYLTLEARDGRR